MVIRKTLIKIRQYLSIPTTLAKIREQKIGEQCKTLPGMWEHTKPLSPQEGVLDAASIMESHLALPEKLGICISYYPAIPTLREIHKQTWSRLLLAALFV